MTRVATAVSIPLATVVAPDGVIGRTDERLKVKGVKVYPESIATVLASFDGLTGEFRVTVDRPESTDRLTITCDGDEDVDRDRLTGALTERLLISPDSVEVVSDFPDWQRVVDSRH